MNYKSIIKSQALRRKILRMLSFIPDKPMIKLQYRLKMGRKLDLKNPKRFTEKLQWYKLNYKNPLMIRCVDKYDVREYVKSKGLEDILIPCYGVYDSADDIDWDSLPNQFVMKDTLGGGGNSVIIVKDKKKEDIGELKRKATEWTKIKAHVKSDGREWPYYSGKNHRIIIEKYIDSDPSKGGLIDYKYFCFNGTPTWIYIIADRIIGKGGGFGIYDATFEKQEVIREDERPLERVIKKPLTFELMKEISAKLSDGFPEARIDLYEVDGEVKFGEITFFDGSGYMTFNPDSFDEKFGDAFILPESRGGGYNYRMILTTTEPVNHGLLDYKFFCFNGTTEFIYVMGDREGGERVKVRLRDREFKRLPVLRVGDADIGEVSEPQNYQDMLMVAEKLAEDFPHVRVDLYNIGGEILFGELTFYNASGYMQYEPDNFDYMVGSKFHLE